MTTRLLAIAEPPWQMPTPPTAQLTITVLLTVVVAGFLVAAAIDWRRTGRPLFALMLAGGLVCSFNEPTVDVLGHCFFPVDGWIGFTIFNRGIPAWVILAYVIFFGGLSYVMAKAFELGATRRTMWIGIGIFGVLNTLLELPMLGSDLYVYYDAQPLQIGGFPLSWLVINSLGSLFGAVLLTRLSWFFTGLRQALVVLIPFATYMSSWVLAMPYFAVTNTDAPGAVRTLAAIVSLALGLAAIDTLIRIGTGSLRFAPPVAAAAG